MKQKINYLAFSILNYFTPFRCPCCGSENGRVIDRKYLVTRLIKCENCALQYRHPVDKPNFNETFYQAEYTQDDGITTDLPDLTILNQWLETNFKNTGKNADKHISVLNQLFSSLNGKKIVDYGSTWGYTSFQFKALGMIVDSYEISIPRAKFGENLGLEIRTNVEELSTNNDVFYNSHVIEHLSNIPDMFSVARKKLRPGGFMVTFCPNGSLPFAQKKTKNFHSCWGLVHPNYLSDEFFEKFLHGEEYYIGSSPYNLENIKKWGGNGQVIDNVEGDELLCIVKT